MSEEAAQPKNFFVDPFEGTPEDSGDEDSGSEEQVAKKGFISPNFNVQTSSPIESLSSEFGKAYAVSATGVQKEVYAIVIDKRLPVDHRVIKVLENSENGCVSKILESGKLKVGNQEQFAIILEKPLGRPIRELVESGLQFTEKKLREEIIKPINDGIYEMHEAGFCVGNINPDNVYFEPSSGQAYLRESLSEFCGYNQEPEYETIDRIVCERAGKGRKDPAADFFALGVLSLYLLTQENPGEGISNKEMLARRLEEGTINIFATEILASKATTKNIQHLLRGLLNDNNKDRWGVAEIDDWCNKKDKGVPSPSRMHRETTTAFVFEGKEYFGRKHLVHDLQKDWNIAKAALKIEDVARWVKLALKLPRISDLIEGLEDASTQAALSDDKLSRIIHLLDNTGPVRFKEYTINIWGVSDFIACAFIEGKRDSLQALSSIFSFGLVEQWISVQESPDEFSFSNLLWTSFKVAQNMNKPSLGFGMERCLYMLNPDLVCQSKILNGRYASDLGDLLLTLDDLGDSMKDKADPLDRHVAAFIGQKIDLTDEIRVKSVQRHPALARNPQISMLALLTVAQSESGIRVLKGLTNWMKARVTNIAEEFYNARIKRDFLSAIDKASRAGSLNDLFKAVSNPSYINRDQSGFIEAKRQYKALSQQIAQLGKQSNIEKVAYQYGLKISVIFAYFVATITLLLIVVKAA